ncbi:MAG: hypothetical protein JWN34_2229 [Bryobacterales bacterium]|nr:hypothetical protein [Bryobacterales bacterium]
MQELAGKDGVMYVTETSVRLVFDPYTASSQKSLASPREIPLTSIVGVDFEPEPAWGTGALRLILQGESTPTQGASTELNTLKTSSRSKHRAQIQEFVATLQAAIDAAVPKVPLAEQPLSAQTPPLRFESATYLGGLPGTVPQNYPETLVLNSTLIGTGAGKAAEQGVVYWADCDGISVEGGDVAKSRVAATVLFGVAGLATKGTIARVLVTAHKRDGTAAVYQIDNAQAPVVRATLVPLLRKLGIPIRGDIPVPTISDEPSAIELLERLGRLHEAGVLTDDEFTSKKRELLSRL